MNLMVEYEHAIIESTTGIFTEATLFGRKRRGSGGGRGVRRVRGGK